MKTRIISACVLLPLFVLVYLGGLWLDCAVAAITVIADDEMIKGFKSCGINPQRNICSASVVLMILLEPIGERISHIYNSSLILLMFWLVLVITMSLLYGFKVEKVKLDDVMATAFVCFYPTFFFHFVTMINNSTFSHMIWFVFLSAFGADIFAYFTGMAIGKHKLCPVLSPKKTIEGAVGGVFGSVILCLLFGTLVLDRYVAGGGTYLLMGHYVIIGIIGSVAAQLGDLSASSLKRRMGIKDYGKLIPGHGGIMDRFDSVLFTAPFIYIYGYIAVYMIAKG